MDFEAILGPLKLISLLSVIIAFIGRRRLCDVAVEKEELRRGRPTAAERGLNDG